MISSAIDFAIENFIGGQWAPGTGWQSIDVFNPASGGIVTPFTSASHTDVDNAVAAARAAQPAWAARPFRQRSEVLRALAQQFEANLQRFIDLEILDAGKPVTAASTEELPDIVDAIHYFAGALEAFDQYSELKTIWITLRCTR
jgi:betaine-aldehyde dehydrogenase